MRSLLIKYDFTNETGQSTHSLPKHTHTEREKMCLHVALLCKKEKEKKSKKRFLTECLDCECNSMQRIFQANRAVKFRCKISFLIFNPKNLQKRFHSHLESQEVWKVTLHCLFITKIKFKFNFIFIEKFFELFSVISY